MKEYNFFITDHQWSETEWETTRICFVTNMDPSFYNCTQAHQKFNEMISGRSALKSTRKLKIPQFRMVFSSPKVRHASHTVSTKAYAIEVMQDTAAPMLDVLQTLFRETPIPNPHSRQESPCPDPATLMPGQVVWNSLQALLLTSSRSRIPPTIIQPVLALPSSVQQMEAEGAYNANLPIPTPLTFLQQAQSYWAALFQQPNGPRQVPDGNRPVILSLANQRLNNSWGDTFRKNRRRQEESTA
jgi:hypothetical protein